MFLPDGDPSDNMDGGSRPEFELGILHTPKMSSIQTGVGGTVATGLVLKGRA